MKMIGQFVRETVAAAAVWAVVFAPAMAAAQEQATGRNAMAAAAQERPDSQKEPGAKLVPAAPAVKVAAEKETESPKERSGGPHEGIKVHGHWTIVVRNEDGSIASRHEFENALTVTGMDLLAGILSRSQSIGDWAIEIGATPDLCTLSGTAFSCFVIEPGSSLPNFQPTRFFPNLTVGPTNPGGLSSGIILSGSAKTTNAGMIGVVNTKVGQCFAAVAPTSCFGNGVKTAFTSQTKTPAISVQAGQTVDVTITISFS